MGFMLGGRTFSLYGPDTTHAFGHLGFTNVISWADPERAGRRGADDQRQAAAVPEIYYLFDILRQIGQTCPKVRPQPAAPAVSRTRRPAATPRRARRARVTA